MRKRSYTIEADSIDEYIQTAQKTSTYLVPSHSFPVKHNFSSNQNTSSNTNGFIKVTVPSKSTSNKLKKKLHNTSTLQNQDSDTENDNEVDNLELEKNLKPKDVGYWQDFDFDSEGSKGILAQKNSELNQELNATKLPSMALSEGTADTDSADDYDGGCKGKKTVVRRIMVIGQNGAGKHCLINGLFECENSGLKVPNQIMDLLSKTEEENSGADDEGIEVRYQFWLQSLPIFEEGNENEFEKLTKKYEDLINLYYKRVELFVFMYSITDKRSFACLEKAVQKVLEQVPIDKFTGVLLGAKGDLEGNREVPVFDGIALQEKHKLTFFMETSLGDKNLKGRLVQLLNEMDEGTGEMCARKGHSILSIE